VASLEDLQSLNAKVRYSHVQTFPFDSNIKCMTVVYHDLETGINVAFTKGAPEYVLDVCICDAGESEFDVNRRTEILQLMNRFSNEGLVRPQI